MYIATDFKRFQKSKKITYKMARSSMPSLMRNWLFEHLTFKIQHLVRCQSTLANLEKTKKRNSWQIWKIPL
jgi:hypothetical protein